MISNRTQKPAKKDAPKRKNEIFDGLFSDSETEETTTELDIAIKARMSEKIENVVPQFKEFMSNPEFITGNADPKTNIVDRNFLHNNTIISRTYNIPEDKIPKMFKFIETYRRRGIDMILYEKQQKYSGFMIDFDIYQFKDEEVFNEKIARSAVSSVIKLLCDHVDICIPNFEIYIAITKKPKLLFSETEKRYKDGFHILVPGVKLTRCAKRFLIAQAIEDKYFSNLAMLYKDVAEFDDKYFIDVNSAHVPIHFLGSSTKPGSTPYGLFGVYKYCFNEDNTIIIDKVDDFDEKNVIDKKIIVCHELSVNWEKAGGIIKKSKFSLKEQFQAEEAEAKIAVVEEKVDNLSLLRIHDPECDFVMKLLDVLDEDRAVDYGKWRKVICALASKGKNYKCHAEYFSKKCPEKYDEVALDKVWQEALGTKNITMGSIHYWAKLDNPEKYKAIKNSNVFDTLLKKVYDPMREGHLGHYDVAQILYSGLKDKYIYDTLEGGSWFEFILPEEGHSPGEPYKWRTYNKYPSSMSRYISEIIPQLYQKVHGKIIEYAKSSESEEGEKYHAKINSNFKLSGRSLMNNGFKHGIMSEAQNLFEEIGFSKKIDSDPMLLGVGNGVLKLGKECEFFDGYHEFHISKFTDTNYKPFNPYEPFTKKLLINLRNMFPDDEPDTFEFMMHYLSSALDGRAKESMILMLVGSGSNGKSFLVELIKGTLSETYAVKIAMAFLTSRQTNSESATPALMQLSMARFAYYSETDEVETLKVSKLKEITGQETLSGRKIYGDVKNFKPKCHHLVTTNYDFRIPSNDHGTWRRIKRISMKIKFCKEGIDAIDKNNPYDRPADRDMAASWPDLPEIRSAFLSILVHYYESLWRNYGGIVENVPHPHIMTETEKYRNRQDTINQFINNFIVVSSPESEVTMASIIDRYCKWYTSLHPEERNIGKALEQNFENSKIGKLLTKGRSSSYLKGYRLLGPNEEPEDHETFLTARVEFDDLNTFPPEPADAYYARMVKEYDLYTKNKEVALREEKIKQDKNAESMRKREIELKYYKNIKNAVMSEEKEKSEDKEQIKEKEKSEDKKIIEEKEKGQVEEKKKINQGGAKYDIRGYRIEEQKNNYSEFLDDDAEIIDSDDSAE
jgi:phage/plasmid-associated DNA primase